MIAVYGPLVARSSQVPDAERAFSSSWDLVTPDQLGLLLSRPSVPDLWFLNELSRAGKVVARSGNGDLPFVGRSLDSMCSTCLAARWPAATGGGRVG